MNESRLDFRLDLDLQLIDRFTNIESRPSKADNQLARLGLNSSTEKSRTQ